MEKMNSESETFKDSCNPMMTLEELPDVLTAYAISDFLGLSNRRVYELMDISNDYGGIPCLRIGRSKRVLKSDFIEWLNSKKD